MVTYMQDKKVIEKGVEVESSNLLEFNSALSKLKTWKGPLTRITGLVVHARLLFLFL